MGDEKKPWEIGKSFGKSAPIGEIHPVDKIGGHFSDGAIWLKVNGTTKQNATLRYMIWSVPEQIARLSAAFDVDDRTGFELVVDDGLDARGHAERGHASPRAEAHACRPLRSSR